MMRYRGWLNVSVLASLASCVGAAKAPAPAAEGGERECRVRLPARGPLAAPSATQGMVRAAARSQVVVHAQAPLAALREKLESQVQPRLAEGRVGIGVGGAVSYTLERGAFVLSTTASQLVIEIPVQARAEACRGNNCYASCEPQAVVRAEVSLMLRPDYRFSPAAVSLRFTRSCKVRALGGLLTIDVTPTIEAALAPELSKVGQAIDRQLPDVRGEAQRAWQELSAPRELPLGACLLLQPSGLVQGPLTASNELIQARFAVLMTPELRGQCGAASAAALPPLRSDASLPEEGVVRVGMVTPLANLAHAWQGGTPAAASGQRFRASAATVTARGSDAEVALTLTGDVCGELVFGAQPDFSADGQYIGLKSATLAADERQRLVDAELDAAAVVKALAAAPRVEPLLSVQGFRTAAPALASALSQPPVTISARISSVRGAGAAARGDELVAWLEARGRVLLSL